MKIRIKTLGACAVLLSCATVQTVPPAHQTARPGRDTIAFETTEGTWLAFDVTADGRWIVFDLLGQLWRIPIEGGAPTALTDAVSAVAEDLDPAVSPDGSRIVFQSDRPEGRTLYLTDSGGGPARKLVERQARYFAYLNPAWSPDGRHVAYAVEDTLAVVDVATGIERVLAIDSIPAHAPGAPWIPQNAQPTFSPDGSRIAFVNARGDERIWEVAVVGGVARPRSSLGAQAPAYSPNGEKLAFFARDSLNRWQVFVQDLTKGDARRLTDHEDVIPVRLRWLPDGSALLYSADGGFWRVPLAGGEPRGIPFTATVKLLRERVSIRTVTFPEPGTRRTAVGFAAFELAPDGQKYAMIALDTLWIVPIGGAARPLVPRPTRPLLWDEWLAWSPDSRHIAWIRAEGPDVANVFAADVETGTVRRITALQSRVDGAMWSPDGRWIATAIGGRLRLVPANGVPVSDTAQTPDLGPFLRGWGTVTWSAASDAIVIGELPPDDRLPMRGWWIPLGGERQRITRFPRAAANLHLSPSGHATYVENNLLWRVRWHGSAGMQGDPVSLASHAAIEARHAADGSVLYLGAEGFELLRADGSWRALSWPLTFTTSAAPAPVLITGARVIDGRGTPLTGPQDVLLENGRIARISPAGTLGDGAGTRVIDATGQFIMPGMIDLHAHIWEDRLLAAWLHNGVTTVRDVSSQRIKTPDSRNRIEAGALEGPRIVYAAGMFHGGMGYSTLADQMVSDSGAISRGIAIMAAMGSEYIKERGFGRWSGAVHVVREAHRYGLPVSGHCSHVLPVAAAGIDGREHVADCYRDWGVLHSDFSRLARAANQWVVTTASVISMSQLRALDDPTLLDSPDVASFISPGARDLFASDSAAQQRRPAIVSRLDRRGRSMRTYRDGGVLLAAGTDNEFPLGMQHELEALVRAGLPPMEAIVAGTSSAARALNAPGIGAIAEGKLADLLLLAANPLEDITNLRRITHVIVGGRVVDRETLRAPVDY